jgi:hypothetical protein
MQRIGYTKGPSASELKDYDKIFDGNLTASNIEALDALFMMEERVHLGMQPRRQLRRRKATS